MHQPFGSPKPISVSVPRSHARHPTDTYPHASEVTIRKAIAAFLPKFKDKELFNRAMCWCADTADANLLICEHPLWKVCFSNCAGKLRLNMASTDFNQNFFLATGDSG